MSLTQDIRKEMFEASKVGNTKEADILKLVLADIKNEEISIGETLSDEQVLKVLRKQKKRVEDSIEGFTKMNREDLISKEKEQLQVLERYLPAQMSEEDITKVVKKVLKESNATSLKDMGMIMGKSMKELGDSADGNTVRNIVQSLLS
ncbi:MAG: Glutaminyl-tRNA synthase b subunit [candidate division WS6 bacterium GW2011_GWE1_34_7]|uniref:Glutaminyl-tRNA synthase b subunit n=1 Tax=candidate division WS6 bacterium GW2011_GWE1_34_7 TaxID=1619093 RepID=A0A0G0EDN0_9BACT|nr:MAG: Glutaminyl-tRNA synthase b subunit [candidate division WS6 bacterium GW2011_GWE1_34_7]